MNKSIKTKWAFTLIELLVVIAIIGILSALIVVGMSSTTQRATIAKAQVFSNSLRNSLMGNLISEWKFDGNANDSWSGGNNGTWYGAGGGTNTTANYRPSAECVSGQCLNFDGTDDYIDCSSGVNLNISNNITISGWIKFQNGARSVMVGRGSSGVIFRIYIFGKDTNNKVWWNYSTDGTLGNVSGDRYSNSTIDDSWHYIAMVFSSGISKFYIDGNLDNTITLSLASIYAGLPIAPIYIGQSSWSGGTSNAHGSIDEVRIFDAAMPTSQIQQMYFAGLNKLLTKNQLTTSDYNQRLVELTNNYAKE
jgi:prepilin-type N-terminal cleavage/methylation domain-containing protein